MKGRQNAWNRQRNHARFTTFLWRPPCGRAPVNSSGLLCCGVRTAKVSVNTSSITIPDSRGLQQGHWRTRIFSSLTENTPDKSHSSRRPGALRFTAFGPKVWMRNPWSLCDYSSIWRALTWRTIISGLKIAEAHDAALLYSIIHCSVCCLDDKKSL